MDSKENQEIAIVPCHVESLLLKMREKIKFLERKITVALKAYHLTIFQFFTLWAAFLWEKAHPALPVTSELLALMAHQDYRVTVGNIEHCESFNYLKYTTLIRGNKPRPVIITPRGQKITPPIIETIDEIENHYRPILISSF